LDCLNELSRAVLEAEAVVSGLQNMAVMREPVQQRRRHLRVAEDAGPLDEAQVGGDQEGYDPNATLLT